MKDDLTDQEYTNKRESEFNMKLVTSISSYTMINQKQQLCLFQVCLLQAVKQLREKENFHGEGWCI